MKSSRSVSMLITIALTAVSSTVFSAAADTWFDTFYQYRIPVVMDARKEGWNVVPITETNITTSVNSIEELKFDSLFFAYNQIKVVEVDDDGKVIDSNPEAGFYLVPESEELFIESITGQDQEVAIPTEKGAYYLGRYNIQGGGKSPFYGYVQYFPVGNTMRNHSYMSSYEPSLLPKRRANHEIFLQSDGRPMIIYPKNRWVKGATNVSVKKVKIVFLINCKTTGRKHWMIYYQPMCNIHLMIPELRRSTMPDHSVNIRRLGVAEKYSGRTQYRLEDNNYADLWFAETTVKITPNTPVPAAASDTIHISTAANEQQSFQIIIRPKRSFRLKGVDATVLKSNDDKIPRKNILFHVADYVPIKKSSWVTPATCLEMIADPLIQVSEADLSQMEGNHILWITVKIPAGTKHGIYKGTLLIETRGNSPITVPLSVKVYDFELPEISAFQCGMGGTNIAKRGIKDGNTLLEYHGLKTKKELKNIARAYYQIMAENKFYPQNAALFSEIGMKWSPPPEGYNVNKPGNYFKFHDWDFSEFNRNLRYYIDELKINSFCLNHTNPKASNLFKHLPGAELKEFAPSTPHVSMAWQTFRERTFVVWGKRKGDGFYDETIEVTQDQWDHLVLDYYRTMAKNLEEHGWLDRFYILVDETHDNRRLLHYLELLKSDPLTARLKVVVCMQGQEYLHFKEGSDDTAYAYNGLITYMPEINEPYNRWEKYLFTDYDIIPDRSRLWGYNVTTSRSAIDAPGINNRVRGLDIFNRGGSGNYIWDTFIWGTMYGDSKNPWEDPYVRHGNGALAFFYPPNRKGISPVPDFTITPSLRVMTHREAVEDYDYAIILEDLIDEGEKKGVDVSEGKKVIKDIERFFYSSVHWSQNDAFYLELRDKMAKAIVNLNQKTE